MSTAQQEATEHKNAPLPHLLLPTFYANRHYQLNFNLNSSPSVSKYCTNTSPITLFNPLTSSVTPNRFLRQLALHFTHQVLVGPYFHTFLHLSVPFYFKISSFFQLLYMYMYFVIKGKSLKETQYTLPICTYSGIPYPYFDTWYQVLCSVDMYTLKVQLWFHVYLSPTVWRIEDLFTMVTL